MGVYIKDMEMPKSCSECRFFVDAWCYAFEKEDWRNAYNKPPKSERLNNCPLVPVPAHGRLIDADELLQSHSVSDGIYFPDAYIPATAIKAAPTIISAEEGE